MAEEPREIMKIRSEARSLKFLLTLSLQKRKYKDPTLGQRAQRVFETKINLI
jgi:hypothetical protein